MAKKQEYTDENGQPINDGDMYANLPSVSDILNPKDAGEITYKLDDIANRKMILTDASIEAGTFGSYASMTVYDPATKDEKRVTCGAELIMTQISALINTGNIPCRVVAKKLGKTWVLQ